MTTKWTLLTPQANVLLALDSDPETTLGDLADDAQVSYRWMVKITSDLLEAGYLRRQRRGRTFSYEVTCPGGSDLSDARAARVQQLAYVLATADVGSGVESQQSDDEPIVGIGDSVATVLHAELERLRHEVLRERMELQRVQDERRHLEAAVRRAKTALREFVR